MTEEIIEKSAFEMAVEALVSVKSYIYVFIISALLVSVVFILTNRIDASTYVSALFACAFISILFKSVNKEKE